MEKIRGIVLHIPHASPVLPFGRSGWDEGIEKEINRWTDWYTDWLFASLSLVDSRIVPITYPFSRFFCDVERLENDPLEAIGKGRVYRRFGSLKRTLSKDELAFALTSYREHQERLVGALLRGGQGTLLVDCHSFPEDLSDVDVCIGVNDDWSRPEDAFLERVQEHFQKMGYWTEINDPYSNSVSPDCGMLYRSLMIEVNKRTYMRGETNLELSRAEKLRVILNALFFSLI